MNSGQAAQKTGWLPATLRALRHRNFQLFFSGQLVSLIGTWMQNIAESWLVYRLTGSALLLGAAGFASQIPVFLVAPLGGIVADRFNRQRIVIGTQISSMILALVFATLTLTGVIRVWHIFVLAALLGVVNAFDIPARQSFLVDMVGKEDLMNAIALNSTMFNGARIVGPAIAGILVARIGEGWCFLANGLSYIAVISGLLMMRVTKPTRLASHGPALAHLIEGYRFARHTAPIRSLLLLLGLVSLVAMPYTVLMPVFADQILHGGARGLGILMGATGVGAMLGALTLATRSGVLGLGRWVAFSCGGFGFFLVMFSFSHHFWLSAALAASGGILHDAGNVVLEHADSGHDSRPSARPRDGDVHHDVHGNGALWLSLRRSIGRTPGSHLHSCCRRGSVHRRSVLVLLPPAENPCGSPPADPGPGHRWRRAVG